MKVKKIVDGKEVLVEEDTPIENEGDANEPTEDGEKELWLTGDEPEGDEPEGDEPEGDEPEGDEPEGDEPEGDEPEGDDDKKVSVKKHIHMKQKLKRRASEKEKEAEKLRAENEELKRKLRDTAPDVSTKKLVRPNQDDFDDDSLYKEAINKYEQDLVDQRLALAEQEKEFKSRKEQYIKQREAAVDEHYERAAKLIEDSKIDPDVYKKVEDRVFEAVEEVIPKMGIATVDHFISIMGEGSEKVLYYIGRNKTVFDEFKNSLRNDKTGISTSLFLGKVLEKLNGTKNKQSRAKRPAPNVEGDKTTPKGEVLMLKKYKAAHGRGDSQEAFSIRRQARAKGINVSSWTSQV